MPDYTVTIPFALSLINIVLGIFILYGRRDWSTRVYALFVVFVALWCFSIGMIFYLESSPLVMFAINLNYISAVGTVLLFLIFTKLFPRKTWNLKTISIVSLPIFLIAALILLDPSLIIKSFVSRTDFRIEYMTYAIYTFVVYTYILSAFYSLYSSYRESKDYTEKSQTIVVALGTTCGYLVLLIPNIILPWFLDYSYIWIGPIASLTMTTAIGYAMSKHHLFDIKVIATELFTFLLWLILLIRVLTSDSYGDALVNGLILVFAIFFGILLIKSVIREVKNREKIEGLATELAVANDELNSANVRLKGLDKQKSEFVSIASHQLRSPLTAIKGYVSMLLEGTPSYGDLKAGKITEAGYEALDRVFKSANALVLIIEDLLNISRIEQGRMQYTMTDFNLRDMVKEIADNMTIVAREHKLDLTFGSNDDGNYTVNADSGKIRQVIGNIIDNSIKYTPSGSVKISLHHSDEGSVVVAVKDTGIGIPASVIGTLFQKFTRSEGAGKVNVTGTGIGLYIAQEIMKAHGGKIWIESPGEGKGSTFFIEFIKQKTQMTENTKTTQSTNVQSSDKFV
ncbi:MAG: hypothetical protein HZA95_03085 [Candidatus Vogelbacteria bacterium]|nr:hypothetical protein [Candidatus Vogelbacteria bacterium]